MVFLFFFPKTFIEKHIVQYIYDANEAEAWMSEQELYMMSDERGKDEFGTENQIKKHERHQQEINQFADTIRDLAERAQKLVADKIPLR